MDCLIFWRNVIIPKYQKITSRNISKVGSCGQDSSAQLTPQMKKKVINSISDNSFQCRLQIPSFLFLSEALWEFTWKIWSTILQKIELSFCWSFIFPLINWGKLIAMLRPFPDQFPKFTGRNVPKSGPVCKVKDIACDVHILDSNTGVNEKWSFFYIFLKTAIFMGKGLNSTYL